MLLKHHILMGTATGLLLGQILRLPLDQFLGAIGLAAVAVALPDADASRSAVRKNLPTFGGLCAAGWWVTDQGGAAAYVNWLPAGVAGLLLAVALGVLLGAVLPRLLPRVGCKEGSLHHPVFWFWLLLGSVMLTMLTHYLSPIVISMAWLTHLIGDGLTYLGLPWNERQRIWVVPSSYRSPVGGRRERLAALLWLGVMLSLVLPGYLARLLG